MIIISKQLILSDDAKFDLFQIQSYISKDSIFYSNKTVSEIYLKFDNLILFPYIGRKIPEYNNEFYREIFYKSYIIFYKIDSKFIIILNIFHHSRDISKLNLLS